MVTVIVPCSHCDSTNLIRYGYGPNGKQRFRCQDCRRTSRERPGSATHDPVFKARARVGEALALGNQLYADRQYAAAVFQFKKVLRLDPASVEATQKVRYAQNFLQDTQLNDRFTRLE